MANIVNKMIKLTIKTIGDIGKLKKVEKSMEKINKSQKNIGDQSKKSIENISKTQEKIVDSVRRSYISSKKRAETLREIEKITNKITKAENRKSEINERRPWANKEGDSSSGIDKGNEVLKRKRAMLQDMIATRKEQLDILNKLVTVQTQKPWIDNKERIQALQDRLGVLGEVQQQVSDDDEKQQSKKARMLGMVKKMMNTNIASVGKTIVAQDKHKDLIQDVKKGWIALGVAAVGAMTWMIATSPQLGVQMKLMKIHTDKLGRAMGKTLAPAFEWITNLVKGLVDWFLNLPEPVQQIITITIALIAVLFLLAAVVAVVNIVMSPWLLIILAIIIVIAAIVAIIMYWDEIMAYLIETWENASIWLKILMVALGWFLAPIIAVIVVIKALWDAFKEADSISEFFHIFLDSMREMIDNFFANVFGTEGLLGAIGEFLASWIGKVFDLWDVLVTFFDDLWALFEDGFTWEGLGDVVLTALKGIGNIVIGIINGIMNVWNALMDEMIDWGITGDKTDAWLETIKLTLVPEFAKGALTIPETMYAKVHAGEMIIPSAQAQSIRQGNLALGNFGGATPTGAGGTTIMKPSFTFNVYEARDVNRIKKEVSDYIMKEFQRMINRK